MKPVLPLFLACLATLASGASVRAQSFAEYPEARIDTYPVRGDTAAEIYASINRNAPARISSNQTAHAVTRSQFYWRTRNAGGWCEVDLRMDLSVIFPQHIDPNGLSNHAWEWWQSYKRALEMHEAGHVQITYETYPVLLEALQSGPCETAEARGQVVLDDLERRQLLYDEITGHGARTSQAFN